MLQPGPAMARNNARFTPKAREGTEIVGNLDAFLPSCGRGEPDLHFRT
jgi:hypothetical protein